MARTSPSQNQNQNQSQNPPPAEEDLSALPFEAAMTRLETAVHALETGGLGLDEALSRYEQGIQLLSRCHALLERAERQVALLTGVGPDGTPQTTPFNSDATASAPGRRSDAPSTAE